MGSQVSFLPCSRDLDPIKLHFPRPKIMQFHGVGRQIPTENKTSNQVSIGHPPMEFHFIELKLRKTRRQRLQGTRAPTAARCRRALYRREALVLHLRLRFTFASDSQWLGYRLRPALWRPHWRLRSRLLLLRLRPRLLLLRSSLAAPGAKLGRMPLLAKPVRFQSKPRGLRPVRNRPALASPDPCGRQGPWSPRRQGAVGWAPEARVEGHMLVSESHAPNERGHARASRSAQTALSQNGYGHIHTHVFVHT